MVVNSMDCSLHKLRGTRAGLRSITVPTIILRMSAKIAVVDGLGGGLGAQIVEALRLRLGPDQEILALATNSRAAERMIKAGARRGASGENALSHMSGLVDIIVGPIGIVIPHSMMGEISPGMAEAIASSQARLVLLPLAYDHFTLAGMPELGLSHLIAEAVRIVAESL